MPDMKWIPVTERLPGFDTERVLVLMNGDMILGYPVYEKIHTKKGFIRVLATYGKCKTIVGKVYTEQEFEKYITNL